VSVDSVPCLIAWADDLGGINYPLLSDFYPHGELAKRYGVFREEDGTSERAIFVIDKKGVIRYVDVHDIDDLPDNEELFKVLAEVEGIPVPKSVPSDQPQQVVEEKPLPEGWDPELDLIMYCTDWCPACRRARVFLKQYGIKYKEVNVSRDRDAAALVRSWNDGAETTPTFNVKGTIVSNFRRPRLMELLGIED
jgi:glutaredoxin